MRILPPISEDELRRVCDPDCDTPHNEVFRLSVSMASATFNQAAQWMKKYPHGRDYDSDG